MDNYGNNWQNSLVFYLVAENQPRPTTIGQFKSKTIMMLAKTLHIGVSISERYGRIPARSNASRLLVSGKIIRIILR